MNFWKMPKMRMIKMKDKQLIDEIEKILENPHNRSTEYGLLKAELKGRQDSRKEFAEKMKEKANCSDMVHMKDVNKLIKEENGNNSH